MYKIMLNMILIFHLPMECYNFFMWKRAILRDNSELCSPQEIEDIKLEVSGAYHCFKKRTKSVLCFQYIDAHLWDEMLWDRKEKAEDLILDSIDREIKSLF